VLQHHNKIIAMTVYRKIKKLNYTW